jgi:hypothetical protein
MIKQYEGHSEFPSPIIPATPPPTPPPSPPLHHQTRVTAIAPLRCRVRSMEAFPSDLDRVWSRGMRLSPGLLSVSEMSAHAGIQDPLNLDAMDQCCGSRAEEEVGCAFKLRRGRHQIDCSGTHQQTLVRCHPRMFSTWQHPSEESTRARVGESCQDS